MLAALAITIGLDFPALRALAKSHNITLPDSVAAAFDSPRTQAIVDSLIRLKNISTDKQLALLEQAAVSAKRKLLLSPSTATGVRNAIATEILDRVKGKPTQTIQSTNMSLTLNMSPEDMKNNIARLSARINELQATNETVKASVAVPAKLVEPVAAATTVTSNSIPLKTAFGGPGAKPPLGK